MHISELYESDIIYRFRAAKRFFKEKHGDIKCGFKVIIYPLKANHYNKVSDNLSKLVELSQLKKEYIKDPVKPINRIKTKKLKVRSSNDVYADILHNSAKKISTRDNVEDIVMTDEIKVTEERIYKLSEDNVNTVSFEESPEPTSAISIYSVRKAAIGFDIDVMTHFLSQSINNMSWYVESGDASKYYDEFKDVPLIIKKLESQFKSYDQVIELTNDRDSWKRKYLELLNEPQNNKSDLVKIHITIQNNDVDHYETKNNNTLDQPSNMGNMHTKILSNIVQPQLCDDDIKLVDCNVCGSLISNNFKDHLINIGLMRPGKTAESPNKGVNEDGTDNNDHEYDDDDHFSDDEYGVDDDYD
jgi:hypothetical protein